MDIFMSLNIYRKRSKDEAGDDLSDFDNIEEHEEKHETVGNNNFYQFNNEMTDTVDKGLEVDSRIECTDDGSNSLIALQKVRYVLIPFHGSILVFLSFRVGNGCFADHGNSIKE